MNKTIIKVVSSEWDHEFIGTKSEAKKFYLKIALEIRNTECTYANDIRKFTFDQLIFFVFENSNCHKVSVKGKEYQVYWYQNPIDELIKGQWLVYNFSWKSLCEYPNGNVFNSNMINPHC